LAKVERIKKADLAAKSFRAVWAQIDQLIEQEILPPIKSIDQGDFDNYMFKDGKWCQRDSVVPE
jgi:hypothetical protein